MTAPDLPDSQSSDAPPVLPRSANVKLGLAWISLGVVAGALGWLTPSWPRWLVFGMSVFLVSAGTDHWLRLLPHSRSREIARNVVSIPAALFMLVLNLGGAVYGIFLSLSFVFMLLLVSLAYVARIVVPNVPIGPAHWYVALLATLALAAYTGDRVLWPIKWFFYVSRGPDDDVAKDGMRLTVGLVRLINFRRLAYQIAILAYIGSVSFEFADVAMPSAWESVSSVALQALLAFLGVDAYVSAFHPKILEARSPIQYEFRPMPWDRWRRRP